MADGSSYLASKLKNDLLPPPEEKQQVQTALDSISSFIDTSPRTMKIAERYPCGSWEKATMLRGRKEADLVVVAREAPHARILSELKRELRPVPGVIELTIKRKAIELAFVGGVRVDLLPVGAPDLTTDVEDVDPRFRMGLNGRLQAEWFKGRAHGTLAHPTTLILKALQRIHPEFGDLTSFGIELLVVDVLGGRKTGELEEGLVKVLKALANDPTRLRGLIDPADPDNHPLQYIPEHSLDAIAIRADTLIRSWEKDDYSRLFLPASMVAPAPATNLGGRTLG